ncbi:MAG: hypothetical protein ACI8XB_000844 [Patiriisocius sp.]|jgi:hypothetical protein
MKNTILIALALFLMGTVNVTAQDKKVDRVKQQVENLNSTLNLDDVQMKKVTAIYQETEVKLEDLKGKLISMRERKVNLKTGDEKAVEEFNTDYTAMMGERKSIMDDRKTAVSSILNDEQKVKFEPKTKASTKKSVSGK